MELLDGNKISLDFYRLVSTLGSDFIFHDKLLSCNDDVSPSDSEAPCKSLLIFDGRDWYVAAIFTLCILEADLTKVPKELFQVTTNKRGKEFYKICYELHMSFTSASIFFELVFEGVSYGSVRAKF